MHPTEGASGVARGWIDVELGNVPLAAREIEKVGHFGTFWDILSVIVKLGRCFDSEGMKGKCATD